MENKSLSYKTITSILWKLAERVGAQGVAFLVTVVLSRILSTDDYGLVAILMVFITILQVFVDSGLGNALIQKKDADELDFSSVFYFNCFMCLVIYLLLFLLSPFIADIYKNDQITVLLRVVGIIIIISGLKNVQQAYVAKHLMFKRFFYSTLAGTVGAAVIGIWMAISGYGVWALITQYLFNSILDTVVLWMTVDWRPTKEFSFSRLKGLWNYGWKLLVSSLLHTIYQDLRQLLIGTLYTPSDLAFFNKGKQLPNLIISNINTSINSVLLPVMSFEQDRVDSVKQLTRKFIKISSYLIWPMLFGLAAIAEPLVIVIFTEKWLPAVPFIRVFCIALAFEPIQTANLNAIKAMGRSDLFLKMEIIKKTIGITILLVVLKYGTFAIALSVISYVLIAAVINAFPNRKLLGYNLGEQIVDVLPATILSILMSGIVYIIGMLNMSNIFKITIQIVIGVIAYIGMSMIFKVEDYRTISTMVKTYLHKGEI